LTAQDRRTLDHFNNRTLEHVQGPFSDETWSRLIPQLIQHDSAVRNAAFALSALHEHYLGDGHGFGQVNLPEYSLHHYQKALRQVIRTQAPEESFDSVLGVCVISCQIESLRGGFEEATRHAVAGMKMIADYRGTAASKPGLRREDLRRIYSDLQYQVLEANAEEFSIPCPWADPLQDTIPVAFKVVEEALPYLHRIGMRHFNLYEQAEVCCNSGLFPVEQMPTELIQQHASLKADFESWASALSQTETVVQGRNAQQQAGFLALKIFEASMRIDIDLFPRGEDAFDEYIAENKAILKLVEVFFASQSSGLVPGSGVSGENSSCSAWKPRRYFTASLGIVGLLFDLATRTADCSLRNEALRLLRLAHRREGIWDSMIAANLVERLAEFEDGCRAARSVDGVDANATFVVTEIKLLSDAECLVHYGFKRREAGSFYSHWFEGLAPKEGPADSVVLDVSSSPFAAFSATPS
jgi:hypothetical protein